MKNKLCFVLLILLVLTGLTFCVKEDSLTLKDSGSEFNLKDSSDESKIVLPTLTLQNVNQKTCTSVTVEGHITDLGKGWVNAPYGLCWSTTPDPTIKDNKTEWNLRFSQFYPLTSPSLFGDWLFELCSGTTYYVRAYVTYGSRTSYSNQLSFTTKTSGKPTFIAAVFPLSLSCTGVIVAFDITDDGGYPLTKKGVCWATTPNPTTENNLGCNEKYDMEINGVIYHNNSWIVGLEPAIQYHARPYLINSAGTFYGEELLFTTNSTPIIKTVGVTEITRTTAKVTGNIISTGGSFVVERGIIFDTVPNRTTVMLTGFGLANHFIEQEVQSVDAAGEFNVSMTNLIPGTCYYVSTFVGVMTGLDYGDQIVVYGEEIKFTTKP